MKTNEELQKMSKAELIAYYATLPTDNGGVDVDRKLADLTVVYDPELHAVLGICDQDCIAQLTAIGKPTKVRVSNTKNAQGKNYANVSQESADLLWKHTQLYADAKR